MPKIESTTPTAIDLDDFRLALFLKLNVTVRQVRHLPPERQAKIVDKLRRTTAAALVAQGLDDLSAFFQADELARELEARLARDRDRNAPPGGRSE
jgi:hypothetical protein